jgi:hypothetical protein
MRLIALLEEDRKEKTRRPMRKTLASESPHVKYLRLAQLASCVSPISVVAGKAGCGTLMSRTARTAGTRWTEAGGRALGREKPGVIVARIERGLSDGVRCDRIDDEDCEAFELWFIR